MNLSRYFSSSPEAPNLCRAKFSKYSAFTIKQKMKPDWLNINFVASRNEIAYSGWQRSSSSTIIITRSFSEPANRAVRSASSCCGNSIFRTFSAAICDAIAWPAIFDISCPTLFTTPSSASKLSNASIAPSESASIISSAPLFRTARATDFAPNVAIFLRRLKHYFVYHFYRLVGPLPTLLAMLLLDHPNDQTAERPLLLRPLPHP